MRRIESRTSPRSAEVSSATYILNGLRKARTGITLLSRVDWGQATGIFSTHMAVALVLEGRVIAFGRRLVFADNGLVAE